MRIDEYKALISTFLSSEISAPEFKERFVDTFLSEPGGMPRDMFFILEDLFEDAEAFTEHWPPSPGLADVLIDEEQLRQEARTTLDALDRLPES
ncbi:MAG: colicin immunity domain-containing protein [Nitrolancea sp.]